MGKMIKMRVEGLSKLKQSMNQYRKAIEKVTAEGLKEGANIIAQEAKVWCKAQSIASTIKVVYTNKKYEITTSGVISAYLEFGTGNFAKALLSGYPDDWRQLAYKFYISGLGRMPAQPYLYPAYVDNKQDVVTNIGLKVEDL